MTDAAVTERDIEFSAGDFERVRTMIRAKAGIDLNPGKQNMVYSRLSRRLRETGHQSFDAYLQWLENVTGPQGDQEWQEFTNCLTTNLTATLTQSPPTTGPTESSTAIIARAPILASRSNSWAT